MQTIMDKILCFRNLYGFEAMRLYESLNTPFSIISERFPRGDCDTASKCVNLAGPSKLINDNGCSMHHHCLNQDFRNTRLFVEEFH